MRHLEKYFNQIYKDEGTRETKRCFCCLRRMLTIVALYNKFLEDLITAWEVNYILGKAIRNHSYKHFFVSVSQERSRLGRGIAG